jgi:hypothetical protein
MSLPNRSHSVTEMATINGDQHHRRSGLTHSNSTTNNSLLYQRSLSYVKTMNDYNFESTVNGDHIFRTDKYNTVKNCSYLFSRISFLIFFKDQNSSKNHRSYQPTTNEHSAYRTNSISQVESDDIYRLQRLYHQNNEQEKYKNHYENEHLSNTKSTTKLIPPAFVKTSTHETK